MRGMDIQTISAEDLLPLIYASLVEDTVSMGVSRQEVRQEVEKRLAEVEFLYNGEKLRRIKDAEEAGTPTTIQAPEAEPFVLTPQMQAAFGLKPPVKHEDS